MTGRPFAPVGFDFTLSALFFRFQDWPATYLPALWVGDSSEAGQGEIIGFIGSAVLMGNVTLNESKVEFEVRSPAERLNLSGGLSHDREAT